MNPAYTSIIGAFQYRELYDPIASSLAIGGRFYKIKCNTNSQWIEPDPHGLRFINNVRMYVDGTDVHLITFSYKELGDTLRKANNWYAEHYRSTSYRNKVKPECFTLKWDDKVLNYIVPSSTMRSLDLRLCA